MDEINSCDIAIVTDYLPTVNDVISGIRFIVESKQSGSAYHIGIQKFLHIIAKHIMALWNAANIPTMTEKAVVNLIQQKRRQYLADKIKLKRLSESSLSTSSRPSTPNTSMLNELFDIASCKCFMLLTNVENLHEYKCKCLPSKKIPDIAIRFYIDQRTTRQLLITSIGLINDISNEMSIINENLSGFSISDSDTSNNIHSRDQAAPDESQNLSSYSGNSTSSTISDYEHTAEDPDFKLSNTEMAKINAENVMKLDLTNVAIICDAKNVSSRTAACIVSATLHAQAEALTRETKQCKPTHIPIPVVAPSVFKSVLNRTRRKGILFSNKKASEMVCFQFDGKICETLTTKTDVTGGRRNELVKVEYIVIVKQPGDNFVASIPAKSGSTAAEIFKSMKDYLEQNNIYLKNVVAIGCDGAPVNTGVLNGIIRHFENFLNRPLQWIICLLHLNELIFHRIFAFLDSSSISPHSYSSELGQQLLSCETLKPIKFNRVELDIGELPENIDSWKLTGDQLYLLEMAKAINCGYLSEQLTRKKPGKMHKARWITTMSRLLRLYMATKDPSIILIILVQYIMKVYIPVLLAIKNKPTVVHGSQHLHLIVSLCKRYFDKNEQRYSSVYREIMSVVNNNAYFANSENILLSMITDKNKAIRKEGYNYIITNRLIKGDDRKENVRYFEKPRNINFNAKHYKNMITLNVDNILEPPILQKYNLSLKDLDELSNSDDIIMIDEIPSHTQATERFIQVTAQKVKRTSNLNLQQGAIYNTALYRNAMPKFDVVKDFQLPTSSSSK